MNVEQRTKGLILQAMLDLTKEKRMDKITVQDIIERSGIAKQTFYNHFKDKFDLMNYAYESDTRAIYENYAQTHDLYGFFYRYEL